MTTNEYHREYQRKRYSQRRNAAIISLGGCCIKCGSQDDLQFDHVDPSTKSLEVGRMFSKYSQSAIDEEMEKCCLLCIGCHRSKSAIEATGQPAWNKGTRKEHGSYYGVYTLKCQCLKCSKYKEDRLSKRRVSPRFPKPLKG